MLFDESGLLRCSKSCRLRWTNYLRPGIKRGNFTDHEEKMIIHLQALLGNRYNSKIPLYVFWLIPLISSFLASIRFVLIYGYYGVIVGIDGQL